MKHVHIIIGSTRSRRIGDQVAGWLLDIVAGQAGLDFELVDLADWPLPLADEPEIPARGHYVHEHTKAWSRKVAEADAYIFVTPQYNWGYPAVLKNALDHLYAEWSGKPALIASYAYRGGGKAAAQLRQVLDGLHMRPTPSMPAITFNNDMLGEDGRLARPTEDFAPYAEEVRAAVRELSSLLAG